ncbi:ABC transporter permease subunit [Shewanella sp. Scap07]|uniref:PhnE/PtxC family ABC transporter permease n=1 Tax=Shewanella sp. Scap07 TaxID=2589987 RepID=UPI0015BD679F|nr:ABC transporter permease subunit [Shewanella sp. Scap07]QLE87464.1 ABC transporter permease subunit [Shewanella sp. Scap07]
MTQTIPGITPRPSYAVGYWQKVTVFIWTLAIIVLPFADLEIVSFDPWIELGLMIEGIASPDFFATEYLISAIVQTINFALLGITFGLLFGLPLALIYRHPWIATLCSLSRAIHEVFWALLFLQVFGLSPITGILAITIPFAATFARVFSDILEQSSNAPLNSVSQQSDRISRYTYCKIAQVLPQMMSYTRYRFECALRSSAVLGFIGMPTLGFYLETAFRQGNYHEGAALLMIFIVLIGCIRFWCRAKLIPFYLVIAILTLADIPAVDTSLLVRFLTQDILPPAISDATNILTIDWSALGQWYKTILFEQALPGTIVTVVLALLALAATHLMTLQAHAIGCRHFLPKPLANIGQLLLLVGRSIPEYILAFIFLMILGPSMLPAILALGIHNGTVIAYLTTRQSRQLQPQQVNQGKFNLYHYHIVPTIYPSLMALLFYRFEIIVRETAVFGMLGVMTLGFYIDSNFSEIRYSQAIVLIACTALLNVFIDSMSRRLLKMPQQAQTC